MDTMGLHIYRTDGKEIIGTCIEIMDLDIFILIVITKELLNKSV